MYDIDALAIGNVESAVRKLIDSLTQFRSTSASQASQIVEEEVNHFQIALKEILRLLADELQPTESGEAPSTDRLVGKLNKAIDYVQSISKYGSGFPDLRVIKHELASLRQEVDCSFSATFDVKQNSDIYFANYDKVARQIEIEIHTTKTGEQSKRTMLTTGVQVLSLSQALRDLNKLILKKNFPNPRRQNIPVFL